MQIIRIMLSDLRELWLELRKNYLPGGYSNPKKYAQIFQTQKNTRLNLQPPKIQELKILDPKKYVGTPPSRLYPSTPPGIVVQTLKKKKKH